MSYVGLSGDYAEFLLEIPPMTPPRQLGHLRGLVKMNHYENRWKGPKNWVTRAGLLLDFIASRNGTQKLPTHHRHHHPLPHRHRRRLLHNRFKYKEKGA